MPILYCEHCGVNTSQAERGSALEEELIEHEMPDGQMSGTMLEWSIVLFQCSVCDSVSLRVQGLGDGDYFTQLYPVVKDLSGIPEEVESSYVEAKKIKNISPLAFAVLVRRSLEFIARNKNATGRNLNEQIADLALNNVIPDTLAEMTDILRLFGNIGAHANDRTITQEEVRIMEDFFLAVVEYVYIAPEKIRKAQERLTG